MKIVGYYVTLNGVACAFRNVSGSYRAGILVPVTDPVSRMRNGKPAPAAYFSKPRDARRAIHRSVESANELHRPGTLIEEWARKHVPSYFALALNFSVEPLAKQ